MAVANDGERTDRLYEFEHGLEATSLLRAHERARTRLQSLAEDHRDRAYFEGLLLSEGQLAELRSKWPRKVRQAMSRRWSFTEMVEAIDASPEFSHSPTGPFRNLLHNYGLSSHLIHCDQRAVDLMVDRLQRPPQELELLEQVHLHRLLSDVRLCWFLLARAASIAAGKSSPKLEAAVEAFLGLLTLRQDLDEAYRETQRDLYEQ